MAIDFIGLLPIDKGFDCIVSMTNWLGGADIHIIPRQVNMTAKDFTILFFKHWYCKNGLLVEIISDHDKLFMFQCKPAAY
jgi:hypothetical protein